MGNKKPKVYAVVLVGGKGKRLRPLSTDAKPKAFLSVTRDKKTMFRKTLDRLVGILPKSDIVVVANKDHAKLVLKDFPSIDKRNLILEPVSRNTAPAIALAAATLEKRSKGAIMAVLPTDQYIINEALYIDAIKSAIGFVQSNKDALVVLGIKPEFPSTHLGYMRVEGRGSRVRGVIKVEQFTEKPDLKKAQSYVKSGKYFWNAGAFVFKASAILKALKAFAPEIYTPMKDLKKVVREYGALPDISIDYAVMEKAGNIYCVRGNYDWCDLGSFKCLQKILKQESRKFILQEEKIVKII